MKAIVDGLLVIICVLMMSISVIEKHLFTAALYLAFGILFYWKLERDMDL